MLMAVNASAEEIQTTNAPRFSNRSSSEETSTQNIPQLLNTTSTGDSLSANSTTTATSHKNTANEQHYGFIVIPIVVIFCGVIIFAFVSYRRQILCCSKYGIRCFNN